MSEFFNFTVFVLFYLIVTKHFMDFSISFVVIYKLFCLVLGLSDGMLSLLLNFVFQNGHIVFDVINVCCCCCLILLFVSTRFLNIEISQQSNSSIFTPLSCLLWRLSYRSYTIFLKNTFLGFTKNNFWVFLSVPHLVDNYAKIVDGRGRNLMYHRTLPSRLVNI